MEKLRLTFLDHASESKKCKESDIINFKENYPDEPLPEHLINAFSLPTALAVMCAEIIRLRDHQHNERL